MATGKKLTGINPLAYMGVEPTAPPQLVTQTFPPTPADVQNNNIGTIWIVPKSSVWILTALAGNVATWVQIYPSLGSAAEFDTDAGMAIPVGDVLQVLGGSNINTAGAGNVLTINLNDSITVDDFEATGNAVIFSGLGASGVLQIDGGGNLSASNGTDGQVLIAATAGSPAWANITSLDSTVTITDGANSIDLSVAGGAAIDTLDGDSGSASGSTVTIAGGSNITTSAAGATVTVALDNSVSVSGSITAGTGFTATTGDITLTTGSVVMTSTGRVSIAGLTYLSAGSNISLGNAFVGGSSPIGITTANLNIGMGATSLFSLDSGSSNIAIGSLSLLALDVGNNNVAVGVNSGSSITSGGGNILLGLNSGASLITGNGNVLIGGAAGSAYTGAEALNIVIGSAVTGTVGESGSIHIGTQGVQALATIAGIFGVTVGGTGIPVVVDNTGQLGTVVSSREFKGNIEDMGPLSNPLHRLRPVTFHMKEDKSKKQQMGLIAEEVASVLPELVVYQEGKPFTVRYDLLPVLLLNELQMMYRVMDMHERTSFGLAEKVAALERRVESISKMTMCE